MVVVELVAVLNLTSLLPNRSIVWYGPFRMWTELFAGLALTSHLLITLLSCVYLSDLYKYFHSHCPMGLVIGVSWISAQLKTVP